MPISPRTSEPLREAVGRLRAACSDAWALDYIDHHAGRCIDDVLRLASLRPGARVLIVATLSDIKKRKRPDAIVYLTTPNFFYAPRFLSALRQGRSGPSLVNEWRKLGELGHMGHVREYSRRELAELFEFTGFRVEHVGYRNSQESRGRARYLARAFDGLAQELVFHLT